MCAVKPLYTTPLYDWKNGIIAKLALWQSKYMHAHANMEILFCENFLLSLSVKICLGEDGIIKGHYNEVWL